MEISLLNLDACGHLLIELLTTTTKIKIFPLLAINARYNGFFFWGSTHMKLRILIFLSLLSLPMTPSWARSVMKITDFKFGAARVAPANLPNSVFLDLGWTPLLDLEPVGFRAEISIAGARDNTDKRFFISNYEGYVMLPIMSVVTIEAGGGLQYWHGANIGAVPVASTGIMFRVGELIDRLYINFSYAFLSSGNTARIVKSGIGFNF